MDWRRVCTLWTSRWRTAACRSRGSVAWVTGSVVLGGIPADELEASLQLEDTALNGFEALAGEGGPVVEISGLTEQIGALELEAGAVVEGGGMPT